MTEALRREGIARELVNRIQNIRKSSGLEITDKINIEVERHEQVTDALADFREYITTQVLAQSLNEVDSIAEATELDFEDFIVKVKVTKA